MAAEAAATENSTDPDMSLVISTIGKGKTTECMTQEATSQADASLAASILKTGEGMKHSHTREDTTTTTESKSLTKA